MEVLQLKKEGAKKVGGTHLSLIITMTRDYRKKKCNIIFTFVYIHVLILLVFSV